MRRSVLTSVISAAALLGGAISTLQAAPSASADRCVQLKGKQLGGALIEDAERITKAEPLGGDFSGPVLAPVDVCRVRAAVSPVPNSNIKIEVWLPDAWNGKMVATGGGGMNGGLRNSDKEHVAAVARGYAGVINDVGHDAASAPGKWGYQQPERIVDFGHRGNHVAAVLGKAVIAEYYGKPAKHSYFQGCSGGGREALMLAQRYPSDYDGIIAGAPAADFTGLMTSGFWNSQRVYRMPESASFAPKAKLLRAAVEKECDELDGVKDGVINDPLTCKFDPAELQCKSSEDQAGCLTSAEVNVAREVYRGPHAANGSKILSGAALGSEAGWEPILTAKGPVANLLPIPFFQWIVTQDPNFSPQSFDLDRDYALAKSRLGASIDATNPDLSGFTQHGGKLLMYHGWEDGLIPAGATLDYYAQVRGRMGDTVDRNLRLFMMPGVSHCAGGPGPTAFDKLDVLDRWVESGVAPERIVASKYENETSMNTGSGKLLRTRPVCAWPKLAQYKGTGSTDDAANFTCEAPRPATR
jgi:feruloyl esterase